LKLWLSDHAAIDIVEATRWYEGRSPQAAERFLTTLRRTFQTLERFPSAAPLVEADARRLPLRGFPHVVYYAIRNNEIFVIACIHGRRSDETWMERLVPR
jgi:plasmid stabilization system protein ParE